MDWLFGIKWMGGYICPMVQVSKCKCKCKCKCKVIKSRSGKGEVDQKVIKAQFAIHVPTCAKGRRKEKKQGKDFLFRKETKSHIYSIAPPPPTPPSFFCAPPPHV